MKLPKVNLRKIKNTELLKLEPSEKLELVGSLLEEAGLAEDIDVEELITTAQSIKQGDVLKIAKIMLYIKCRYAMGMNRIQAFKTAFPERSIYTEKSVGVTTAIMETLPDGSKKEITEEDIGKPLSDTTIHAKAKQLEATRLYKLVVATLSNSLYATYAIERFKVLDLSLEKIFDKRTKDKDRIEYMKVFLQETRKPEEDNSININIQNNDIKVVKIEEKLSEISNKISTMDAGSIIKMLNNKEENE